MIDAEKLAAFALVTATTSLVPGQSMLFVMGQAVWRGARSGWGYCRSLSWGAIIRPRPEKKSPAARKTYVVGCLSPG